MSGVGGGGAMVLYREREDRHVREPLAIPYRGGRVYATPELTCGPTLAHVLALQSA